MTTLHFDAIVIGLGAIGAATYYQLAQRGTHVLGIDRFNPPHDQGSSHGQSRISRLAIGEGDAYVPLVKASHRIWRELEERTGRQVFTRTGGLILAPRDRIAAHHGKSDFVRRTIACAERHGIAHEVLDAAEVQRRYPQFQLQGDELAYFERDAGFVRPEEAIAAQLEAGTAAGGQVHANETVLALAPQPDGTVVVQTDLARYTTDRVVVAAGPWLPEFLTRLALSPWLAQWQGQFKVYRQVMHWFDVGNRAAHFAPGTLPIFIWMFGDDQEDYMYGFPSSDPAQPALKVATEQYLDTTTPDTIDRTVAPAESEAMLRDRVAPRIRGVTGQTIQARACLYTVTPDRQFVIDQLPDTPNVVVASACSGHGFKHSAGIGEAVALQVLGGPVQYDLSAFRIARLFSEAGPASSSI